MNNFQNNLTRLRASGLSRGEAIRVLYECYLDALRLRGYLQDSHNKADLEGLVWIYGEDSPEGQAAKASLAVQADQQASREAAEQVARAKQEQVEKQLKEVRALPETPKPPVVPLW